MVDDEKTGTLDVRDLSEPPFDPIIRAVDALEEEETLLLINAFEPVPLCSTLADRGFEHETTQVGEEEWHVRIRHARTDSAEASGGSEANGPNGMADNPLDLRELAPPERHPKIHAAFAALAPGETLTIINDHEPRPLFYEMQAEVPTFDDDGYSVEQRDESTFVAELPKQPAD